VCVAAAAVPWKLLTLEGVRVVFATETGAVPAGDSTLLDPEGMVMSKLGIHPEPKAFYNGTPLSYVCSRPPATPDVTMRRHGQVGRVPEPDHVGQDRPGGV
jgi:hypothetical protein